MNSTNIFVAEAILTIFFVIALAVQAFRDKRLLEQFPKLDGPIVRLVLIGMATAPMAWLLGVVNTKAAWMAFDGCVLLGLMYANWVYFALFFPLRLETKAGWQRLSISTTQYEELAPGVWVRQYPWQGSDVHPTESALIALARKIRKENAGSHWDCFLFDIGRDAELGEDPDFPLHRYPRSRQIYFSTKGRMEIAPGKVAAPGETVHLPKNEWHHVKRFDAHVIGGTLVERMPKSIWRTVKNWFV